jgi:palmitoyltransferase
VPATAFKFFTQFVAYCTCFCAVVLSASAYALAHQVREDLVPDVHVIVTIAISGFFGIFCFMMTITAFRFIFTNQTNIDILKKQVTYQVAVRVPLGAPPTSNYHTVTYPLPRPEQRLHGQVNGTARISEKTSSRDRLARKTFAILKTEPGENPWHLGYRRNFQSVMGNNVFEYLFPISRSPCTNHEDEESDYPFGPLIDELKVRYGISRETGSAESDDGIELQPRERGSKRT